MDPSPKVRSSHPTPLNKFKLQTPPSDTQDPISTIRFGSCPKFNFKPQPSWPSLSINLPFSLYKAETQTPSMCLLSLLIISSISTPCIKQQSREKIASHCHIYCRNWFSCLIWILKFHASHFDQKPHKSPISK